MSNKTLKIVHLVYGIIMSALVILTAVLFIVSAVGIYKSGARPYSPESIAAHFSSISLPVFATLILAVGGGFLSVFLPIEKQKLRGGMPINMRLRRAYEKLEKSGCAEEIYTQLKKKRILRRVLILVGIVLYCAGALVALNYVANKDNFPAADANSEVLRGALAVGISMLIPFVYSLVYVYVSNKTMRLELDVIQSVSVSDDTNIVTNPDFKEAAVLSVSELAERHKKEIVFCSRCLIFALAAVFIIVGIFNGGAADVLGKAVKICTECIGLG